MTDDPQKLPLAKEFLFIFPLQTIRNLVFMDGWKQDTVEIVVCSIKKERGQNEKVVQAKI